MKNRRYYWLSRLGKPNCQQLKLTDDENIEIRDLIVNDSVFAERFFFDILNPMLKGCKNKILYSYGVEVPEKEIASIIYLTCSANSWSKMNAFRAECGIFTWVAAVSAAPLFDELEELGYIIKKSAARATHYRLTLKSLADDDVMSIVEMIDTPLFHDILVNTYLHRMSDDDVMQSMHLTSDEHCKLLKLAEKTLVEMLLAKGEFLVRHNDGTVVNLCREALSKVENKIVTESIEDLFCMESQDIDDDDDCYGIADALSRIYPECDNWREQFDRLVSDTVATMNLDDVKRQIFVERFYYDTDPVVLAERLGRSRSYVDVSFSRTRKALIERLTKMLNSKQ